MKIVQTLSTCTMFCMQPKSILLSYSKIRPDIVLRLRVIFWLCSFKNLLHALHSKSWVFCRNLNLRLPYNKTWITEELRTSGGQGWHIPCLIKRFKLLVPSDQCHHDICLQSWHGTWAWCSHKFLQVFKFRLENLEACEPNLAKNNTACQTLNKHFRETTC